jgi:outer membrane protein
MGAAPLAAQAASDTTAHPIHLADAIRMAQAVEPAAVAAQGNVETSATNLKSAYAAFVPSVSANMSATLNNPATARVNPTTGQITSGAWSVTQGFALAVDIFDGGRRIYSVAAARKLLGAADAAGVAQKYQTAYDVKVQYYAVLASIEQKLAAQAAIDQATQQMRVSVENVKAKMVTKSDSLQSLVALGNARLQMLASELALQTANAALTRLVAAPTLVTAIIGDTVETEKAPIDSASVLRLALAGPSVQAAQMNFDAADASAKAARWQWFPQLTASYNRNRLAVDTLGFTLAPGAGSYSGSLRFNLSYPLFNQWQRESAIVTADVAKRNADAQARDARYAAQESLVQYFGALRTAQQQTEIQTVSVAAADENLRVQQERYKLGMSTILDVLTAQSTLNAARVLLIQARYNYRVAKAQLEALTGSDL